MKYYLMEMSKYNENIMYSKNLPVLEKDIRRVIETVGSDLDFSSKSINLLFFLLTTCYFDLLSVSNEFLRYGKKKSFEYRVIIYAVKNRFSDSIASELCNEIKRVNAAMEDEVDVDGDADADADGEDVPAEEEQAEQSGDEPLSDGEDEVSVNESEAEPEPEPEPPKPAKSARSKNNSRSSKSGSSRSSK